MNAPLLVRIGVLCAAALTATACHASPAAKVAQGTPTPTPSPATTAAAGHRLVGEDDVVIEVPRGWGHFYPGCGYPTVSSVFFPTDAAYSCPAMIPEEKPTPLRVVLVEIGTRAQEHGTLSESTDEPAGTVEHSKQSCTKGVCTEVFSLAGSGTAFTVTAPADQIAAQVATLMAGVRHVPAGYVTVPYVDANSLFGAAARSISAAGLVLTNGAGHRKDDFVSSSTPEAGSVVRAGSTVKLDFNP